MIRKLYFTAPDRSDLPTFTFIHDCKSFLDLIAYSRDTTTHIHSLHPSTLLSLSLTRYTLHDKKIEFFVPFRGSDNLRL